MALIKCPECGKEISDKSKQCIYCGYPLGELLNVEQPKEEIIYDFYLIMSLSSPRVPLLRIQQAKRTTFTVFIDNKLIKDDLRPYDILHIRSAKDFSMRIISNEFRKESVVVIENKDNHFVVNDLQPRVFMLNYFNTGFTVSLSGGLVPITDGYNYKQGIFNPALVPPKKVGPMSEEDLQRVIKANTSWCKAYSGRDSILTDIIV